MHSIVPESKHFLNERDLGTDIQGTKMQEKSAVKPLNGLMKGLIISDKCSLSPKS